VTATLVAVLFAVVVWSESEPPQRYVFEKTEVTIGRVPGNDLVLPHASVSRRHARIVIKNGRFILVDLKSTNGTFVNGRRLTSPLVISEHDQIAIGYLRLALEDEDAPTTEWAPAPPLDPVEEQLIAAVAAGDHTSRTVYADWLEERGEAPRAEFLRIQDRLVGMRADDPAFRAGRERLEALARELDVEWRFAVARPAIEGCLALELPCPKEWGSLAATDRPHIRSCGACDRQVYYCESLAEARLHVRRGDCVAIDIGIRRRSGDLDETSPALVMGAYVPAPGR